MSKIGIMGGTFNPIHKGHIEIAKAAYEQYNLDEVWFMPNHEPAYKSSNNIVDGQHRINMLNIAINAFPYFKLSDIELTREGKTYTWETVTMLNKEYPMNEFYFIMGADSLFYFDKWVNPDQIISNCNIIVATRDQYSFDDIDKQVAVFNDKYGKECFFVLKCTNTPCSSSKIRESFSHLYTLNLKEQLDYLTEHPMKFLDHDVFDYIIHHDLYK